MNKEKKHILTLFVAVIIVSATIATAVPMAMNYYEDKDEEGKTLFVKAFVDLKEGIAPHSVNFTSIVMNSEGDVEYLWDFGDGETSNLKNPNHTYIENNTYICNLTAKDSSGAEATNSIAIYAIENRKPTVSIEKPTPNARRPLVIWYEFIPKQLRFDTYTGSDYWFLRDKSLLPKSFTSKPGFYTVTASANDLDGDEIVNYTWILNPPEHTNRKNQVQRLEFVYYGQTITFPIEDIYPSIDYDLKCIVTD